MSKNKYVNDITLTIPETLEIIWKDGSATSQRNHYGSTQHWLIDHIWKKYKKQIACKNLGQ